MGLTKAKDKAQTEIKDLEVREVSVVDKPAIRRTFLIVKSEDGDVAVIRQENKTMPPETSNEFDASDVLDLLSLNKGDPSPVTTLVDSMMNLATTAKAEGENATLSDALCTDVCTLVDGMLGESCDVDKAAAMSPAELHAKLETAVGQVSILAKACESDTDTDVTDQIRDIGSALVPAAQSPETKKAETHDGAIKIFVGVGGDDPEVIVEKAGAKMKSTRLSSFEKAVNALVSILNEIKGENKGTPAKKTEESGMTTDTKKTEDQKAENNAPDPQDGETQEETQKGEGDQSQDQEGTETVAVSKEFLQGIKDAIESTNATVKELGEKLDKGITDVNKRVDDLDAAPAGEGGGDPDPEATEKTKKPFWGHRFA